MKKKRLIVVILLVVIGLPLLSVVGYRLWRGPVADTGNPRPETEEAPEFNNGEAGSLQGGEPKEGEMETDTPGGSNGSSGEPPQGEPTGNGDAQGGQEQTAEEPIDDWQRYGWPDDFELPLEIIFDGAPEVPEAVRDPLPPTEKDE